MSRAGVVAARSNGLTSGGWADRRGLTMGGLAETGPDDHACVVDTPRTMAIAQTAH
jgi:hypothetical protein